MNDPIRGGVLSSRPELSDLRQVARSEKIAPSNPRRTNTAPAIPSSKGAKRRGNMGITTIDSPTSTSEAARVLDW